MKAGRVVFLVFLVTLSLFIVNIPHVKADENYWVSKAELPTARYSLSVVAVNGKLYAIGGYLVSANHTNEEYDPLTNTWTTKAPIPTPREYGLSAVAVWQNQIYVLGGWSSWEPQPTANEIYDPITDSWKAKSPVPTPRNGYSACTVGNKIYVIGGGWAIFDRNFNCRVEFYHYIDVYDPATDSWSIRYLPSTVRLVSCQSVAFEDKIYILSKNLIQVYYPSSDVWLPEIRTPVNFSESARIVATTETFAPKRIHIFDESVNYIYEPKNNVWQVGAPSANFPRQFRSCCIQRQNIRYRWVSQKLLVES